MFKKPLSAKTILFVLTLLIGTVMTKSQQQVFKCTPESLDRLCEQQNKGPVCALDDDNQYLTINSACEACGYEDTISFTEGPCKCPQAPCSEGETCLEGKCLKSENFNDKELMKIAKQFLQQEKYKQAQNYIQKALVLNQEDSYAYYLAALAFFGDEKHKQSLRYIKKAIQIDPKISGYYVIRGRAFSENKQYEEAEKQFKKARETGFDDLGLIAFYEAQNLLKNQKKQESIAKFDQALKYHPQKTEWYVRKAMAHAINKEYKMAMITCRQGLKIDPQNKQILMFMEQFQDIDEGQENNLELAQQENEKAGNNSKGVDPEYINKIMKERQEQEMLRFDMKRIQQKRKKQQQNKETQKEQKQL